MQITLKDIFKLTNKKMRKEEVINLIKTNSFKLMDIFYSMSITKSGVCLQGDFENVYLLDKEILDCLKFDNSKYVSGSFIEEDLYIEIVLT